MADASYGLVFPAEDGHLMSAAECHGAGKARAGELYFLRFQEMLKYSDEKMVGGKFPREADQTRRSKHVADSAAGTRKEIQALTVKSLSEQLWMFGVMNYPLPS